MNTTKANVVGLGGALMVLAMLVPNVCNPGKLLAQGEVENDMEHGLNDTNSKEDIGRTASDLSDVV